MVREKLFLLVLLFVATVYDVWIAEGVFRPLGIWS